MKETNWALDYCKVAEINQLLSDDGIALHITFSASTIADETVADVTSASCAHEAAAGEPVSRIIKGVAFYPKPSQREAMIYVEAYLKQRLLDYDSAKIDCDDVSEAGWVKDTFGPKRYGYFVSCRVNAKNVYGGYTGYRYRYFRINGGDFEALDDLPKNGLMEDEK